MSPHENTELLVAEEELYELFERRRPQRDAFRTEVEKRIRAREQAHEVDESEPPMQSSFWRRVGVFLPIDPVGGAVAGSTAGKALGGKLLPTALALPAMVLASVFGGFLAGVRSLKRGRADAAPFDPAARDLARKPGTPAYRGFRTIGILTPLVQLVFIVPLLGALVLGDRWVIDLLTLMLVASMVAVVVTARALARAGFLSRAAMTFTGAGILMMVFLACLQLLHGSRLADLSDLALGWSCTTLIVGVVLCFVAGGKARWASVALVVGVALSVLSNTLGISRTSHASLASQLSRLELDPADLRRWGEAAAIHDALAAVGAETPDLEAVRGRVGRAMRSGDDVHPVVATAAYHMGLVGDRDWAALATRRFDAYRLDKLQTEPGYINRQFLFYEYAIPMLLSTREVSAHERDELARHALGVWPERDEQGALERAVLCVRLIDDLGRPDLAEGLRERAHALLSEHWVSDAGTYSTAGGFTPYPKKIVDSVDAATHRGVELMARFGVPERIDLFLLRNYLRRRSTVRSVFFEEHPYLRARSRASLLRLREEIGMPARTWFEVLVAERLFIAAVMIVVLSLIAIRLAPPVTVEMGAGAQP